MCTYRDSKFYDALISNSPTNENAKATPSEVLILATQLPKSYNLNIHITPVTSLKTLATTALLDSGATGMFISKDFVQKHELENLPLDPPIPVQNIDRSLNKHGPVTEEVEVILHHGPHLERAHLAVVNIS